MFWCPGCACAHHVRVVPTPEHPQPWEWNNDKINPTINPSVLTVYTKLTELGERQAEMSPIPEKLDSVGVRCHLFVKNGFIEYLNDCTHALAGKTVKMDGM